MALFTTRRRPAEEVSSASVPEGYEALAEALAQGLDVVPSCQEIGRRGAALAEPLEEILDGLERTYDIVAASEPSFRAVRKLTLAWSENMLSYMHSRSCEDPLTGLATLAHLRARLREVYREAERAGTPAGQTHALTLVEVDPTTGGRFPLMLRLLDLVELLRPVYSGGETISHLGQRRVGVLAARDERLAERTSLTRELVEEWGQRQRIGTRVWIEGLPAGDLGVDALLDELAR